MGFYYSPSMGLVEKDSASYDTEDEAYKAYYIQELAVLYEDRAQAEAKYKRAQNRIDEMNKQFGWLIEKYPEDFI